MKCSLFQYDEGDCTTKGGDYLDDFSSARYVSGALSDGVHPSHREEGPHPEGSALCLPVGGGP